MTHHDRMASASDRLAVGVAAPHGEFAGVRTDFKVQRWDAEQTEWARKRLIAAQWYSPDAELTPRIFAELGVEPYSVTVDENCNMILQAGWVALLGGSVSAAEDLKSGPPAGKNIPGPFNPLHANGPDEGKKVCLV